MKTTSEILCGLLVLGLSSAAFAYPEGAPGCVINEQRISKMGGKNTNLGYTITPSAQTFQPNKPIVLTLGGSAPFKGLLMFAEGADPKTRNGNFVIPAGYKTNKPACDSQGYKAGPNGAITQTSADPKQVGAKFTWTPDKCESVTIRAVVVGNSKSSWQVTAPVKLTCAGGAAPAAGSKDTPAAPSAGNSTSAPAPPSAGDSTSAPSTSEDAYGGAAPSADSKDYGHGRKHRGKGKACKKNPAGESQGDKAPSPSSKDIYEGEAPKSPEGKPSGGDTPSSAEPKAPATPSSGTDTSSGETPESPSGSKPSGSDAPATPSGSETPEKSTPKPSGGGKPSGSSTPSPAEPSAPATPSGTDTSSGETPESPSGSEPSVPAAPTPAPESGSNNAGDKKAPKTPCSSKSSPTPTTPAPAPSGGNAPSSGGY